MMAPLSAPLHSQALPLGAPPGNWQPLQPQQHNKQQQMQVQQLPQALPPQPPLGMVFAVWMPAAIVPDCQQQQQQQQMGCAAAPRSRAASTATQSSSEASDDAGDVPSRMSSSASGWSALEDDVSTLSDVSGHVLALSHDPQGSRRVQAALAEASCDSARESLAGELRGHVWAAVCCPHANHVVQKCAEVLRPQALQFIVEELADPTVPAESGGRSGIGRAARHRFGCRVLERLVEQCLPEQVEVIIEAVLADAAELCMHPFGNFVIQHLLEHGPHWCRQRLHRMLEDSVHLAATKPHARAVVSCALMHAEGDELASLARGVIAEPGLLSGMACTRHGHVGVVHLVQSLDRHGELGQEVRRLLAEERHVFKSTRFGRNVVAALSNA